MRSIAAVCLLLGAASTRQVSRSEIEKAFVEFDLNQDGVVTKDEMLQSVMRDVDREHFTQ